ncbi:hypothetical protein RSOL_280970, partial [Rhizoctonia solani AG-3 Rhs1AP]
MTDLEALAHHVKQDAVRYLTKVQKTRLSNESVSSIKARNVPLSRSRTARVWTANIQIGSPPQHLDAVLSTYVPRTNYQNIC